MHKKIIMKKFVNFYRNRPKDFMSSCKDILFSRQMTIALTLMLVLFALQYGGIELSFIVFYPIIVLMDTIFDTKKHVIFKFVNIVSMTIVMLIYYAIMYL